MNQTAHISLQILAVSKSVETNKPEAPNTSGATRINTSVNNTCKPSETHASSNPPANQQHLSAAGERYLRTAPNTRNPFLTKQTSFFKNTKSNKQNQTYKQNKPNNKHKPKTQTIQQKHYILTQHTKTTPQTTNNNTNDSTQKTPPWSLKAISSPP